MNQQLLDILDAASGQFVSGQLIAETMTMTRANVWKQIQKLKQLGYEIESVRNLGYALKNRTYHLSHHQVTQNLSVIPEKVIILESVDSTNDCAKKLANENVKDALVIANHQTSGRGRRGRSFYSPKDKGLYMSFLVRPTLSINDAQLLTIASAVAVVRVLKNMGISVSIKWLNDVYSGPHKVCGILTEGEIVLESGLYDYLIVGIGLNTLQDTAVPDEIKTIYGALTTEQSIDRNILAATIYNTFISILDTLPASRTLLIKEYKENLNMLNKPIYSSLHPNRILMAIDVTNDGQLVVLDENKSRLTLNAGEISIRETTYENT